MNRAQTFQEFIATQSLEIPIWNFVINLLIATFLSFIAAKIYIRFGNSLSNRRLFANNFMIITMTTMLIITLVKSSLALSLGLVGALSIVRFRAAIKEPEELIFLFLSIAIGLGLGANQRIITILAFVLISATIVIRKMLSAKNDAQNLFLTVSVSDKSKVDLDKIVDQLKKTCAEVSLKRFDTNQDALEASFLISCNNYSELNKARKKIEELDKTIHLTFLDNRGLGA